MSGQASLDAIFYTALDLDTDEARAAYLDRICGADTPLRRRVEQLLHAHAQAGSFLRLPDTESSTTIDAPTLAEEAGTRIGPYRLLRQIGEGGMGVVWWAEQEQPVRRQVALKIIRPGMDSRQIIARFEIERQALALMDHVNIARVLDAGTTENGRPYFVMELIHGIPITQYCDDKQLTVRERLKLFVPVCQAIQHAHQKGIIHRDIKPSNVLVAEHEGRAVPKVIDFGVAKAMGQRLTEGSVFTHYGTILGTFEYMSPEQADNSPQGIDTRSDIYSLGVLLYELLTGTPPLESQRVRTASFSETVRLIVEEEPDKPSVRLSQSPMLPAVAAARKVEPLKLAKLLRGELDWIVIKALEKDRNRRYETANDLARDIQGYLADEPVEACPPSAWYRLGKLARRHKQALAAVSGVLLALTVLACTVGYFLHERQTRRIEAESEQRHAIETALEKASGLRQKGHWAEARLVLEQARDRLGEKGPADLIRQLRQGSDDLDLVDRLESARLRRWDHVKGRLDRRTWELNYAAALREAGLGEEGENPETVAARMRCSSIREEVVAALDDWSLWANDPKRRAWLTEVARRTDPDAWRDRFRDAKVRRDWAASQALATELMCDQELLAQQKPSIVITLADTLPAAKADPVPLLVAAHALHPDDFWLNFKLGNAMMKASKFHQAVGYLRAALALRPRLGVVHHNLGTALSYTKHLEEAIREYRAAIALDYKDDVLAHQNLGNSLRDNKQLEEAIREYRTVIVLNPKQVGGHLSLGLALQDNKQLEEAISEFRKVIDIDPKAANGRLYLGRALRDTNRLDEAVKVLGEVVNLYPRYTEAHNELAWLLATCQSANLRDPQRAVVLAKNILKIKPAEGNYWNTLGAAHYRAGDWNAAIQALKKSMEIRKGGDSIDWSFLAMAHWQLGEKDLARQWYDKAVQWMDKNDPKNDELCRFRSEAAELLGVEKKSK
jgi:serine/threonine protein kinase/Flp pilus assembly protein TadD